MRIDRLELQSLRKWANRQGGYNNSLRARWHKYVHFKAENTTLRVLKLLDTVGGNSRWSYSTRWSFKCYM